MTPNFGGSTPDPGVTINGLRLLQRTNGVWIAVDERRAPGDQTVFFDKAREKVEEWMRHPEGTNDQRWTVTLTKEDVDHIKSVAAARNKVQREAGSHDGAVMDSQQVDLVGAAGEYAVVRLMNLPWLGEIKSYVEWLAYRETGADVGEFEVKTTKHPHGRLFVRRTGAWYARRAYILARIQKTRVTLAGWAYGEDIKRPENLWDPGHGEPAYYLPNEKLRPMESLGV